jgi:uncharacterized protein (TIGR01777 family)
VKIAIAGGSGLIGGILVPPLLARGHSVTVLTRRPVINQEWPRSFKLLQYDPGKSGAWQEKVAENDIIINLAGSPIFRRWTPLTKNDILKSRILTTKKLVEVISFHENRGKTLLSISGVGIYGPHGDELLTERDQPGQDFLSRVAEQWEAEAMNACQFGMRVVLCRIGNVLSLKGGLLPRLVNLAKYNLGCRLGSGQQWVSWVHEDDLARVFILLIENTDIEGPVNITAPNPVRNAEMMRSISTHLHKVPFIPCLPGPLLRIMAGEFASAFLAGQRVVPQKLLDRGFSFSHPVLNEALAQLLR